MEPLVQKLSILATFSSNKYFLPYPGAPPQVAPPTSCWRGLDALSAAVEAGGGDEVAGSTTLTFTPSGCIS